MYSLSIKPCKIKTKLFKFLSKVDQRHLNPLLDDEGTGLEPLVELLHHLSDELVVVQLLPTLHNPERPCNVRLQCNVDVRREAVLMIYLTMQASISCFLSSSTFLRVSFLSGSASPCLAEPRAGLAWFV